MKWIYSIQQKAQVAFLLAIVLLGVFMKNVIDRNNVSELGDSFSSVYEDRLLVESYIYKLSDHLHQKQKLIDDCSQQGDRNDIRLKIAQHNAAIGNLIQEYEKTKLTNQESVFFDAFKKNIIEMITLEDQYLKSQNTIITVTPTFDQQFYTATKNLDMLSGIQVAEGKSMADHSKRIVAGSSILTQFELAMIIVIGLIIQALIFASNSLTPKQFQKHQLN
jgi:Four helix bundle sensory module for signal transduction